MTEATEDLGWILCTCGHAAMEHWQLIAHCCRSNFPAEGGCDCDEFTPPFDVPTEPVTEQR